MSIDKANLLVDINSFYWDDLSVDREQAMDDLILAFDCILEQEDIIWGHPQCYDFLLNWGYFHEILTLDDDERNNRIPWLREDHQRTLINIWSRKPTQELASNLEELDIEFANYNNGHFGCGRGLHGTRYVHDDNSWLKLHQDFVSSNPSLRATHYAYFKKFYIPQLTVSANQINDKIQKHQVHNIFRRLDIPTQVDNENTLHGEQIQMHFNDSSGSALNIDGTWKHGRFEVPAEACDKLIEWGFLLPDELS